MQTLHVDLTGAAKVRNVLLAIAQDIEDGETSGTVGRCAWELETERPVPKCRKPRRVTNV